MIRITINLVDFYLRKNPNLKRALRMAHIKQAPEQFVKKGMLLSLYASAAITFVFFMFFSKFSMDLRLLPVAFVIMFMAVFFFIMQTPYGIIRKREREINKEVLFAGRYLLVKMESGVPLFNTLIDASKGYGVCSSYFKEIVDEINMGTPIEQALENARNYNASEKLKKILWQIVVSLKTGTDVTEAMRSTLKAITAEQVIEIKEYSKKLNSLMMFYMIIAVVVPSLGMALFIIFSSFLNLTITSGYMFFIIFLLAILQLSFISIIKASRPMVDI